MPMEMADIRITQTENSTKGLGYFLELILSTSR